MHAHDRYALALAILEGDRDARKVLADLLEEEGERGLAQWARIGKHDKRRTLDFVLMTIPSGTAILLGVQFVDHAFASVFEVDIRRTLLDALERCRIGEPTLEALRERRALVLTGRHSEANVDLPRFWRPRVSALWSHGAVEAVIDAMDCDQKSMFYDSEHMSGTPRSWQLQACQRVREVARLTRQVRHPRQDSVPRAELSWQLETTSATLRRLLSIEDDAWPK